MSGNPNTNCGVLFPVVLNSKSEGYFTGAEVPLHQAGFLKNLKQNVPLQLVVHYSQSEKQSLANPITLWL